MLSIQKLCVKTLRSLPSPRPAVRQSACRPVSVTGAAGHSGQVSSVSLLGVLSQAPEPRFSAQCCLQHPPAHRAPGAQPCSPSATGSPDPRQGYQACFLLPRLPPSFLLQALVLYSVSSWAPLPHPSQRALGSHILKNTPSRDPAFPLVNDYLSPSCPVSF